MVYTYNVKELEEIDKLSRNECCIVDQDHQ